MNTPHEKILNDVLSSQLRFYELLQEGSRHHINEFKKQHNFYRDCDYTKSGKILMTDKQAKAKLQEIVDSLSGNNCDIVSVLLCRDCGDEVNCNTETEEKLKSFYRSIEDMGEPVFKCNKCRRNDFDEYFEYKKNKIDNDGKIDIRLSIDKEDKTAVIHIPLHEIQKIRKKTEKNNDCPIQFEEGDDKGSVILGMGLKSALKKVNDENEDYKYLFLLSCELGFKDLYKVFDNYDEAQEYINILFFKPNKQVMEDMDVDYKYYMDFLIDAVKYHRLKSRTMYYVGDCSDSIFQSVN